MRLAALCKSHGFDLSAVAALCGVDPSLLVNIDAGIQALPRALAVQIASVLTESVANVQASALLNTNLNTSSLYTARPPPYGTPITPARITPTVVLPPVPPAPPVQGPNFWIGMSTTVTQPPPDHPVVRLASLNAAGNKLTLVGTALTNGQLHDPTFFTAWDLSGGLPLNRNYILRASPSEVWVLIYGPSFGNIPPFIPYIARFTNDGTLIGNFFPLLSDPSFVAWVMAKDPQTGNVWCSGNGGLTYRVPVNLPSVAVVINPPEPPPWNVYVTDMLFVGGRLYCAFGRNRYGFSDGVGIMEFNPTPGSEAWVQTTPNVMAAVDWPTAFCYSALADTFYLTAPAFDAAINFFSADRATLTLTSLSCTIAEPYDAILALDVTYNAATNKLWFVVQFSYGDFLFYRLVEVSPAGGVASRSITVPFNGDAFTIIRSFFQRDGKLYVQSVSTSTGTSGIAIVDMASGVTLNSLAISTNDFTPWFDFVAPFSYIAPP